MDDSDYDHNITAANASAARFILHVPKYVQYTGCFILNTTARPPTKSNHMSTY